MDQKWGPIQLPGASLLAYVFSIFFSTVLKGRSGEARGSILDGILRILEGFWCDFGSFLDGFRMIFKGFWEDFGGKTLGRFWEHLGEYDDTFWQYLR